MIEKKEKETAKHVSIQPKPKTGLEVTTSLKPNFTEGVSIQPKPKTGLEDKVVPTTRWFRRVSIQPKPKTGLEVNKLGAEALFVESFNPAEAEDGFRRKLQRQCQTTF